MVLVFILQRKMIYFPDQGKPTVDEVLDMGLKHWPNSGDGYRGFVGAVPPNISPGISKGTIIVFHGNAGAAWHRNYYVAALTPLGYRVVLAEYPGYGGRTGKPSEALFIKDAHQSIRLAHEAFGGPIYLLGESLGCGVAAAVAADPPVPMEGIILITPWDSLPDLAQSIYWYLPVRLFLKDRFDNIKNLQSFHKPIAVVIAALDEIIPNQRSLRLYDQVKSPKRLWRFEHAGHNNWPTNPEESWWREVMQFIVSTDKSRQIDEK